MHQTAVGRATLVLDPVVLVTQNSTYVRRKKSRSNREFFWEGSSPLPRTASGPSLGRARNSLPGLLGDSKLVPPHEDGCDWGLARGRVRLGPRLFCLPNKLLKSFSPFCRPLGPDHLADRPQTCKAEFSRTAWLTPTPASMPPLPSPCWPAPKIASTAPPL